MVTALCTHAQSVELLGGSITVQEGTTIELNGPLEFLIQSDAAVINHGVIDLGTQATVNEPVDGPISGNGIEVSRVTAQGPFSALEPGGLGLTLTTFAPSGPITVTRGHTALTFPEGDPSIGRWFEVEAPEATSGSMDLVLNYDATELGLLQPGSLSLFRATAMDGPWDALPSTNDPGAFTVSSSWVAPWTYVTAFDANAPTASSSLFATPQLQVWPTLTTGLVVVQTRDGSPLGSLELLDATGRSVRSFIDRRSADLATLNIAHASAGAYFLRVGQRTTIKLRKE